MKSKPPSAPKRTPTEQQFQAMCRRLETTLLDQGATPTEVTLLRQHSGSVPNSAMNIALMKARLEGEGLA